MEWGIGGRPKAESRNLWSAIKDSTVIQSPLFKQGSLFSTSLLTLLLLVASPYSPVIFAQESESQRTVIHIQGNDQLQEALQKLESHTTLVIESGIYRGGWQLSNIEDLSIRAADETDPPVFKGGNTGWQFSRCPDLNLQNLHFEGQKYNGLNIDDGGQYDDPVTGIQLSRIEVRDVGPKGNFDGIKLSGLDRLKITKCKVSGWGGQAIDLVGCHDVLIQQCQIVGKQGFSQTTGIQCKGGCKDIQIEKSFFKNAGLRPINVGGSTDLKYFRPQDAKYEAKDITVSGNMIIGSPCACAFVGVDGAKFIGNRVNYPEKWIFRILQETTAEGFVPCRNVEVANNNFVFLRSNVRTEINIGPGTAAETFEFKGNNWFAEDQPGNSRPNLPVTETDATYGEDPREVR